MSNRTSPTGVTGLIDRREVLKRGSALGLGAATMAAFDGSATATSLLQTEQGVQGGTLNVAVVDEPPTLDIHQTTANVVASITWNIYEALFTFDQEFQVIPMLAESHEVSDDGLVHTVKLRQGVPFHNGDEMTAADVIASFERWSVLNGAGASLMDASEKIVEVDDYTVEWRLTHPFGAFLQTVSQNGQGMAIYPKSVIDAAGEEPLGEFIGTGPYKFVERQADRYTKLDRFDDYAALPGEPDGYGGHKYQYLDEMMFIPVPDQAARVAGLQAGDYHFIDSEAISAEQSEPLETDPNVDIEHLPPTGWRALVLNWRSPLMGDQKIRQAFQFALDHEQILQASEGEGFYRLDPSVMLKETVWYTTTGEELYDPNKTEQAKSLLDDAGYDGTPLRIITSQVTNYHYNTAVVARQQLEAVGFEVDLQVYDWATLIDRRADPDVWDVLTAGLTFNPDPTMMAIMQLCSWPGWWCSDRSRELLEQLQSESEFDARYATWEKLQRVFYEEVPMIKVGDALGVCARATGLKGFVSQSQLGAMYWNMWLEQ